ncbi:MAG TPA: NERD domain-containing protein/DEAD/DEAH box helicase [Fibrobacteria bacterium]|nr:NERD domain-containing protein/DEAD/DEAH box helicase [Fibrobacteria bacterium]
MATLHSEPHSPSRAEIRFAQACRELSEGWHVFFGVEWTRPGTGGEADHSGEMDAVLYHRDHGILVVEVKGGGVRRNGDLWSSLGRDGWHAIKNPLAQVKESTYFLVHEIKTLTRSHPGAGFPLVAWGLCFPDVEVFRNQWLGNDLLEHQILSRADLDRLESRVVEILLRVGHGLRHTPPTPGLETLLLGRFHPCFSLLPPADEILQEESRLMLQATDHQQQFLLAARSIRRLAVEGCAGSGKSILAADRARLLLRDGESVLLLCYSKYLADRWRDDARLSGVEVATFHELSRKWVEAAGLEWPLHEAPDSPEARIADLLSRAQAKRPFKRWSAVVVDEGQDFHPQWWPLVDGFLEQPSEGSLTVFLDSRQNLLHRPRSLPPDLPLFHLSISVRNTRSIVEWIHARTGWELASDPLCPQGEPPRIRQWKTPAEQALFLREDLREFARQGIQPHRVLVVSCRDRESSGLSLLPSDLEAGWSSPPDTWRSDRANIDSALRTRGLESDVVILADVEPGTSAERIYAGATRARHRLVVYERA